MFGGSQYSTATPNAIGSGRFTLTTEQQEAMVSIALIRSHSKTDDNEGITDEQIALYRETAFELVADYTDYDMKGSGFNETFIANPASGAESIRLKSPSVDGIIQVSVGGLSYLVQVAIGATSVQIRSGQRDIDGNLQFWNCAGDGQGVMLRYKTAACAGGIGLPAGIRQGIMQFVAWSIAHPGDCSDMMRTAMASGAMGLWKRYRTTMGF